MSPELLVLIVDDDQDSANSLGMLMKMWGGTPRVVYDGASALRLVAEFCPDLAIVDLHMPGADGCHVALQLRDACPEALVAALTGDNRLLEAGEVVAAFHSRLIKPVRMDALRELMQKALKHKQARG